MWLLLLLVAGMICHMSLVPACQIEGPLWANCKGKCCRVLSLCSFALLTLPPLPSSNIYKCRCRQDESPQCSPAVAMQSSRRDYFYNRPLFRMLANGGMQAYSPHCSLIVAMQHSRRDSFYNRPLIRDANQWRGVCLNNTTP